LSFAALLVLLPAVLWAQPGAAQTHLYGTVIDRASGEGLPGVNLRLELAEGDPVVGTASDMDGRFGFSVPSGRQKLIVSAVGYEKQFHTLSLLPGDSLRLDIEMVEAAESLDIVVVSSSQYEQRLEETTVSVDVLPSRLIANANLTNLSDAVAKVPGVYLLDGQANIRGGSGFTYGAGSRVLLVVDDQPLLTADRSEAQWAFIPMENVGQIEVIKGANSVLYGASALNGVIHVRTVWPGSEPETGVELYTGSFFAPDSADRQWWDGMAPWTLGVNLWHRQKYNRTDLVLGGHVSRELTHLEGQENTRARINGKLRFRPEGKDNISYGVGWNAMYNQESSFLIWANEDSGAYQPFGGTEQPLTTLLDWGQFWGTIDPFLTVFDKAGGTHRMKGRVYANRTEYPDTTGNSVLLNFDYRYLRPFFKDLNVTVGAQGFRFIVRDGNLGSHNGFLGGAYFQVDKTFFNRLKANAGFRMEFFDTDSTSGVGRPIFKAGLSYPIGPKGNLRASFGQGYRFPSLVERYLNNNVGALQIFSNDTLSPEYGWNGEIGYKRTIRSKNGWTGYADAALYWTEFFDMAEFLFGNYGVPGPAGLGFKTVNISRARMAGLELTAQGSGRIGRELQLNLLAGYNYVYPADLGADTSNRNIGTFLGNAVRGFGSVDSAFQASVLKYRFRHVLRIDAEVVWRKWRLGADASYYSFMENIDAVFQDFGIPPGIAEFRANNDRGDVILGARLAYAPSEQTSVSVLVRNLLDREYALRVGKLDPPRNVRMQFRWTF
jgi:iron complex outermembrane receptor protein